MTTTEAKPVPSADDLPKDPVLPKDLVLPENPVLPEDLVARRDGVSDPAPAQGLPPKANRVAPETRAGDGKAPRATELHADTKVRVPPRAAILSVANRFAGTIGKAEPRLVAAAGSALLLGAILGAGAISLAGSRSAAPNAAITSLATAIDAGRGDTAKLAGAIAKLDQTVAELKAATEAARKDTKGGALVEKLAQLDRSLASKFAGLGDRIDQAEREQTNRIAGLSGRATAAKAEPTQTGSLGEPRDKVTEAKAADPRQGEAVPAEARQPEAAKTANTAAAKPTVLENYALRDIFEGAAIIEGRNRRLFQVVPGDTLPGAGRVEGIERQGRSWVVVTRQGLVTAQSW